MKRLLLLALLASPALGQVTVVAGTYGLNAGAPRGNATGALAAACNGSMSCGYLVGWWILGDPVPGKAKNFVAEWTCMDGAMRSATAPAEAGLGSVVTLSCPLVPPTPTPLPGVTPAPPTTGPWMALTNGFRTTLLTVRDAPSGARARMTWTVPGGRIDIISLPIGPENPWTTRVVGEWPTGTTLLIQLVAADGTVVNTINGAPIP